MNRAQRSIAFSTRCLAALLLTCVLGFAQTAARNLASKIYVAEVTGDSHIQTGDKILPLVKNGVHAPEGSVIETKANATDSLVLSNGTALHVTPLTRIEVKKFLQEPFALNRTDLDLEPSVSQTVIAVSRGALGVCTSKLVAGSSMAFHTPEAIISVRGRRLVIETAENETRVSLLEGDVTVVTDAQPVGQTLQPGQQAVVRKASADAAAQITIRPIPAADAAKLDDTVTLACISRRTVAFETVENPATGAAEITPVQTTPANAPTQFTVSPARL